jgi:hypothetical protein
VEEDGLMFIAENVPTKICPHCAETIKVAAKVCPYCRYWQKKWSLQNPQVGMTLWALLGIAVWIVFGILINKAFGSKENFATYRNEMSVVNSQFSQRIYNSNLWNTVVGTLTNQSDVGWKDVGVEARFFDKSGKMIDAITVNADDYRGVAILPHGETAFKIEGRAACASTDYWTNKLNVRSAKDVDALF